MQEYVALSHWLSHHCDDDNSLSSAYANSRISSSSLSSPTLINSSSISTVVTTGSWLIRQSTSVHIYFQFIWRNMVFKVSRHFVMLAGCQISIDAEHLFSVRLWHLLKLGQGQLNTILPHVFNDYSAACLEVWYLYYCHLLVQYATTVAFLLLFLICFACLISRFCSWFFLVFDRLIFCRFSFVSILTN